MLNRVSKGLLAIVFGQASVIMGNVLLVPLFLAKWSLASYGEWLILSSLASYVSTLDFGVNTAVVNRLTRAYAGNDLVDYTRCQHSAMAFYVAIAGAASLSLAIGAFLMPIPVWFGLTETTPRETSLVLCLLGLQVLWAIPAGLFSAVYRTTGNLARSAWVNNGQRVLALGLSALVLVLGGGMSAVALSQLVPLVLVVGIVGLDLRHRLPALVPGISRASIPIMRELTAPSLLFLLITFAVSLTQQGPLLIVAPALGGVGVAVLATSRTLANIIRQIVGSLNSALWPDLTAMDARQEIERLRVVFHLLTALTSAICIAIAAALWYEGGDVITVWTRGRLDPDLTLLRLLLLHVVLQSAWLATAGVTAATNRHTIVARSYIISAVVGVAMVAALVGRIGTWAVPVGLMVGEAIACYHFVVQDTCRMIGEAYGPFLRRYWLGTAAVGIGALIAGWVSHEAISGPFLIRWAGVGLSTSIASLLLSWRILLAQEDRSALDRILHPLMVVYGGKAQVNRL